ncbi:Hsp20/alpha crystallin family protein [Dactylosporangium sp. NPDC000244]|uniref:Hsp20/alpha crystallin family protein n=1 Tax=Dactylosporangium sp. NPDC000244 TaxID=3154365 RepID=UPI003329FB57
MPLNRWDPTNALARLEQDMGNAAHHAHAASVRTATDGDDLVITVEGIDPSNVDVQVSGGRLTIKGAGGSSTSESHDAGGAHFSSSSSSSSSFSRSFSVPEDVEQSDVSTEPSANGVKVRIRNAA